MLELELSKETILPDEVKQEFLTYLKENNVDIHSVLFTKDKKIFWEEYFGFAYGENPKEIPNSRYALHRMYSVTKSVVSIAIGLLASSDRIHLEDHITDYFPEYVPADPDRRLLETTIKDMLSMRTCHTKTTYKQDLSKNWVESFFTVLPDKEPGKEFNYDTSSSHVLEALVEKITGLDSLSFIKKEIPVLGLSKESYIIKDPFGTAVGGSGLMALPRDILRLAFLISDNGRIEGKQYISEDYILKATSKIVATDKTAKNPFESYGYGYFIWRNSHNGYMFYGMNGQFAYFVPEKDIILVTTADTSSRKDGTQILIDALDKFVISRLF